MTDVPARNENPPDDEIDLIDLAGRMFMGVKKSAHANKLEMIKRRRVEIELRERIKQLEDSLAHYAAQSAMQPAAQAAAQAVAGRRTRTRGARMYSNGRPKELYISELRTGRYTCTIFRTATAKGWTVSGRNLDGLVAWKETARIARYASLPKPPYDDACKPETCPLALPVKREPSLDF
jgi:hypothetical protein